MKANHTMTLQSNPISVGQPAREFTCKDSDGSTFSLSELRGRERVVLVFYPGDNTPVCTAQLCAFRDDWSRFQAQNTRVYGVNPANQGKHAGFVQKHQFPFPLLVDAGGQIAAAYDCRLLFGLIRRTVVLIDRQGKIAYAQRGNPAPQELLRIIAALQD